MNALRETILAALRGSSFEKPVALSAIRRKFSDSAEDLQALPGQLKALRETETIRSVQKMHEGTLQFFYWLPSGSASAPQSAPIAPTGSLLPNGDASVAFFGAAEKVQPNTSIPKPAKEQPTMDKKITGVSAAVIEALQAAPLTFAELFGAVQKRIPAITEKKLRDNLYVMANSMKIAHQGEGAARLYSAVAKPKASPPPQGCRAPEPRCAGPRKIRRKAREKTPQRETAPGSASCGDPRRRERQLRLRREPPGRRRHADPQERRHARIHRA